MIEGIVLDSGVLSLATHRVGQVEADACRRWITDCLDSGARILVPAIANYETRRELLRAGKTTALQRLDAFISAEPDRYIPLTDDALMQAAQFWAQSRQQSQPTADPKALDADVILAAQVRSLGLSSDSLIVATSNVRHIARFVRAEVWRKIQL